MPRRTTDEPAGSRSDELFGVISDVRAASAPVVQAPNGLEKGARHPLASQKQVTRGNIICRPAVTDGGLDQPREGQLVVERLEPDLQRERGRLPFSPSSRPSTASASAHPSRARSPGSPSGSSPRSGRCTHPADPRGCGRGRHGSLPWGKGCQAMRSGEPAEGQESATGLGERVQARLRVSMTNKRISIDVEAYEMLRRARRAPSESFSMVIKRAAWPTPPRTAGALLESLKRAPVLGEEILGRLEEAQGSDSPPADPSGQLPSTGA